MPYRGTRDFSIFTRLSKLVFNLQAYYKQKIYKTKCIIIKYLAEDKKITKTEFGIKIL